MEKKLATTASLFGAALASMLVAPELQADVVSLSFTPATNPYNPGGLPVSIFINEVGANFSQWNDSVGRTLIAAGLSSVTQVKLSQTLSPNTFSGNTVQIGFTVGSSGTNYVGFRLGGNVGWFSFSVAGLGTDIHYLEGGYGNAGENVHVGTVPAPGALALLALGAVGVRRNRKRAA